MQGQQKIAFEKITGNISEFLKRLFQWLSQRQKAVQQDRAFMSTKTSNPPKTGDTANAALWIAILVLSAAESSAAGKSIYTYDKDGTVAQAYAEFTREVIQCGEKQRNKHESSLSR